MKNGMRLHLASFWPGQALLVKMLTIFEYLCISTLSSHWYEKSVEASPNIIFAGRALLVKMLTTLEPGGIFDSNFVYLCILILSSHWYEM